MLIIPGSYGSHALYSSFPLLSCFYYSLARLSKITRAVISKRKGRRDTFYLATFISLANTPSLTHAVTVATMRVTEL